MNSTSRKFRNSPFEWIVVILITCVLFGLLIPAIRAAREHASWGEPVPVTKPDESRRAFHEIGMSIVVPPNWTRNLFRNDRDARRLCFQGGGRYPSKIWVERLIEDIDLDSFTTEFRWRDAMYPCRITIRESQTLDDWRYYQLFRHETLVVRGDGTYTLVFETHEDIDELPPIVNDYLQAIDLPDVEATIAEPKSG